MRRRDEVMCFDIEALEASLRQQEVVRDQETPAEEIARLREASQEDQYNVDREVRHGCLIYRTEKGLDISFTGKIIYES